MFFGNLQGSCLCLERKPADAERRRRRRAKGRASRRAYGVGPDSREKDSAPFRALNLRDERRAAPTTRVSPSSPLSTLSAARPTLAREKERERERQRVAGVSRGLAVADAELAVLVFAPAPHGAVGGYGRTMRDLFTTPPSSKSLRGMHAPSAVPWRKPSATCPQRQ